MWERLYRRHKSTDTGIFLLDFQEVDFSAWQRLGRDPTVRTVSSTASEAALEVYRAGNHLAPQRGYSVTALWMLVYELGSGLRDAIKRMGCAVEIEPTSNACPVRSRQRIFAELRATESDTT